MKIGFDAKRAFANKSGLGNYSRNLIRTLINNYGREDYFLFNSGGGRFKLHDFIERGSYTHLVEPQTFIGKEFPQWWRSYGITKEINKLDLDIYHGLSAELLVNFHKTKAKKIVTIHDLIFIRYPELYSSANRKIYKYKTQQACDNADLILAVSNQTKLDLVNFLSVEPSRIEVTYQSCDENFFHYGETNLNEHSPIGMLPENYILYVGTIEERKNLLTLVKALHHLDKSININLVVIGRETGYAHEVKKYVETYSLEKRVKFIKSINNAILPIVYRKAKAFVYPSVFEGFGIPIIEALASKTPVITTKGGCFTESAGPSSIFINPLEENEIGEAIIKILSDKNLAKQMSEDGWNYVQKFRPEVCSQNIHRIYSSLIK